MYKKIQLERSKKYRFNFHVMAIMINCQLDVYLEGPEDDSVRVETCSPTPMLMNNINKKCCVRLIRFNNLIFYYFTLRDGQHKV
jgi:hypothetical protein